MNWMLAAILLLNVAAFVTALAFFILSDLSARHSAIVKSSIDGFFLVAEDGRMIEVNAAFCDMVGYSCHELLKMKITDLEVPRARDSADTDMARTGHHLFVTTHRHKLGHEVELEISVTAQRTLRRKLLVGFARDITDRKRAEQALRAAEEKYRGIFENAVAGIYQASLDGRFLTVNPMMARILGYDSLNELMTAYTDLGEQLYVDSGRRAEFVRLATTNGVVSGFESRVRRKDGRIVWISEVARVLRDEHDNLIGFEGAVLDVTQRREAEAALRKSEESYRNLVETSHDLIWSVDRDGCWTFVNAAAVNRIYGYEPAAMLGRPLAEFACAEHAERDRKTLALVQAGVPHFQYETEHVRKDGATVALSFNAIPLRNAEGLIIGVTGTAADITERKSAEEEHRRMEAQIQQSQKLESLGLLAGGVAHDFNNLLVGILGNASLACEQLAPDSQTRSYLEKIMNASRRASELTRQMLAYSGKARYDARPMNVNDLVRESTEFMRAAVPRSVTLTIDLQKDLPSIDADGAQIQQIIMNLLINGAEAIGEETGVVKISTSTRWVDGELIRRLCADQRMAPGEYVCLECRDTGCGIAPEALDRIFDPFYTTKFAGRGLGLATCFGIVRAHRGAMHVESSPGEGTVFSVYFPKSRAAPIPKTAPGPAAVLCPGLTVLVIDDEDDVREVAEAVLTRRGARVLVAEDGPSGIELFRANADTIDVVLLDMTMPGMTGVETMRHIAAIRSDVKVVLSSGYAKEEALGRMDEVQPVDFVQKPFSADGLVGSLAAAAGPSRRAGGEIAAAAVQPDGVAG